MMEIHEVEGSTRDEDYTETKAETLPLLLSRIEETPESVQ